MKKKLLFNNIVSIINLTAVLLTGLYFARVRWTGLERNEEGYSFNGCQTYFWSICNALDLYYVDNDGVYPAVLSDLVPEYIFSIPVCPAPANRWKKDAYTYQTNEYFTEYTMFCTGNNHKKVVIDSSYPIISSLLGRKTRPGDKWKKPFSKKMHYAVEKNKVGVILLLLEKGEDINAQNMPLGNTPLHYAVIHNNIEILNLLIENKADLSIKNKNNLTPLQLSELLGNDEAFNLLKEAEVNSNRHSE